MFANRRSRSSASRADGAGATTSNGSSLRIAATPSCPTSWRRSPTARGRVRPRLMIPLGALRALLRLVSQRPQAARGWPSDIRQPEGAAGGPTKPSAGFPSLARSLWVLQPQGCIISPASRGSPRFPDRERRRTNVEEDYPRLHGDHAVLGH